MEVHKKIRQNHGSKNLDETIKVYNKNRKPSLEAWGRRTHKAYDKNPKPNS